MKGIYRENKKFKCKKGDTVIVSSRYDGKAVVLESLNRPYHPSGALFFEFESGDLELFLIELVEYLSAWEIDYTPEVKCYQEEIHVFRNGCERSITVNPSNSSFNFTAYADKNDDYWTYLTPNKLRYFVELMMPALRKGVK